MFSNCCLLVDVKPPCGVTLPCCRHWFLTSFNAGRLGLLIATWIKQLENLRVMNFVIFRCFFHVLRALSAMAMKEASPWPYWVCQFSTRLPIAGGNHSFLGCICSGALLAWGVKMRALPWYWLGLGHGCFQPQRTKNTGPLKPALKIELRQANSDAPEKITSFETRADRAKNYTLVSVFWCNVRIQLNTDIKRVMGQNTQ